MKQLLFCYKQDNDLIVRKSILTDVFVPVQDAISPQKTTLTIPKTSQIEISDIVIIKDNSTGVVEYIGYIDTLKNENNTEIACYPLINVLDNDYVLDQMFKVEKKSDGTIALDSVMVFNWLETQLKRAFIDTDDKLQALPLIITNKINSPVFYKKIIDTANFFEIYVDLFINTGVYIVFSGLSYNKNKIDGIYCDVYCNKDKTPYVLRWDNPSIQNVNIVDNTFTSYNKIIATEEISEEEIEQAQKEGKEAREPIRFYFYLLNDNSITRDATDGRRIKQVRSKEITFSIDDSEEDKTLTEEELNEKRAKALLLTISNELQVPEYNLQITIDMVKNDNLKLYRNVDFVAESGIIYSSNITKIEVLNDLQVRITLGALRNSLTDFKKKMEAI